MTTKKSSSAVELLDNLIAELEISIGKDTTSVNETSELPSKKENQASKKSSKSSEKSLKTEDSAASTAPKKAETASSNEELNINAIDLRVGIIRKVSKHATADKLYCEEIDIGEETPRAIASGLVPYYTLEQMEGRRLIVICNLKPRNLVGFKSNGMVLCASTTLSDGTTAVEFVDPPASAQPGDRIIGEGLTVSEPLTATKCDKLKAFEAVATDLTVDENGIANWKGHRLIVQKSSEVLTTPTIRNAHLK
jgi:aminoacyl tRNA synthase complex-interacting multifunctional protein 1